MQNQVERCAIAPAIVVGIVALPHRRPDGDDAIVWPCGTWCYRFELGQFAHKSDDFQVIPYGTQDYAKYLDENGF